jgi:hypothetical protein
MPIPAVLRDHLVEHWFASPARLAFGRDHGRPFQSTSVVARARTA